jgi:two-component system phosphate regulon sensor histidine kinase PhoR
MKQKNENLTIRVEIEDTATIIADEFHFTNIVYNILDNAVKYCDTQPEILISSFKDSKGLYLQFKDNGIGIPLKIFLIFLINFTGNTKKSDEVNGFGLGLFYVKKLSSSTTGKFQLRIIPTKELPLPYFYLLNECVRHGKI